MGRLLRTLFRFSLILLLIALVVVGTALGRHLYRKLPQRSGELTLAALKAPVSVAYDERGVPHIRAGNELDLYRALGFVHAQDRLFQMEITRRLARGELAEILGPQLVPTDRLFRTLELRLRAEATIAAMDKNSPTYRALAAYIDGVNEFQDTRPLPIEFSLIGIAPRPFTPVDTAAIAGYLSYSFAAALRTEPVLTYVRDRLGMEYLRIFDLDWHPLGVVGPTAERALGARLTPADWTRLAELGALSDRHTALTGLPTFEGSNAWAISGKRTASGKPLLAGDPHIAVSAPAVWYEAHLVAPGFELYGHFSALNPFALLGHNQQFGWSLTMFQNDDMDLVAETVNPANPQQVRHRGRWVDLQTREEVIEVRRSAPVDIVLQRSPHGPILNAALGDKLEASTPIAMWWTLLESDNPLLEAFYELNRADSLVKALQASSKIHAPGLNVVWASASGDIGWWAAARLVQRPVGVHSSFILDGARGQAEKPGFYRFADNPQEENPARGYIVSANHQPRPSSGVPVPGYYNLADRGQRLDRVLRQEGIRWDTPLSQRLQLDVTTGYPARVVQPLIPELMQVVDDAFDRSLIEQLQLWDGSHLLESIAPTVFNQLLYELAHHALADELGETQFANLLRTRALDEALPRLAADADSPWWDNRNTPAVETRRDTLKLAWQATMAHMKQEFGNSPASWAWGRVHTVTHSHPLGQKKPLHLLFNVGPFVAPGGRELPNNIAHYIGPGPWSAAYGPSTRRVIDFAEPDKSVGINPVGQSGVLFDRHHHDQAQTFIEGGYQPQHLSTADVAAHTRSTLMLQPAQ